MSKRTMTEQERWERISSRVSTSRRGFTLEEGAQEFARTYWAASRKVTAFALASDGLTATFQTVGGAGGVYRAAFVAGGVQIDKQVAS